MSEQYSEQYFTKASTKSAKGFELYKSIVRKYIELKGLVIGDFGCAEGAFFEGLVRNNSCYGYDISEHAINACQKKYPEIRKNFSIWDINENWLTDSPKFNLITLFDVIEHLDSFIYVKRAIKEYLSPGGLVLVTTPNANSFIRPFRKSSYSGEQDQTHTNLFTPYTLDFWLRRQGLVQEKLLTPYSFHFRDSIISENILLGGQIVALYRSE